MYISPALTLWRRIQDGAAVVAFEDFDGYWHVYADEEPTRVWSLTFHELYRPEKAHTYTYWNSHKTSREVDVNQMVDSRTHLIEPIWTLQQLDDYFESTDGEGEVLEPKYYRIFKAGELPNQWGGADEPICKEEDAVYHFPYLALHPVGK